MNKRVEKDVELTVVNNSNGIIVYERNDTNLELNSPGDEDFLTFKELKTMASSPFKKYLQNFTIMITEINSDEFSLDDAIRQLKLSKYYDEARSLLEDKEDELTPEVFEEFLVNCSVKELERKMESQTLKAVLTQKAVNLYVEKQLTDHEKLRVIGEAIDHEDYLDFFSRFNSK